MDTDIDLLIDLTRCDREAAERALAALVERGWRPPARAVASVEPSAVSLAGDGPLQAHTDGACRGNPGPGSWAVVFSRRGGVIAEHCGREPHTTNNRMELLAVLEAVRRAPAETALQVVTDSRNVIGWLSQGWKRNNPQVAAICAEIDQLTRSRSGGLSFAHVKGHAGHALNERADRLAVAALDGKR